MTAAKKLILIVIDGLTPAAFEAAADDSARMPALTLLAGEGRYRRAVSAFPSLTPVCLSSIATGAHPDVHEIPHLVWYHRGEQRLVEYGSSGAALWAAGLGRSVRDAILNMNQQHLGRQAVTVFEALEDAGLTPATVNFTCYRGRTRHLPTVPGVPAAYGPKRFFFFNLFESDLTGAPLAIRNRAAGTVDNYAAAVGRWLVTRDGFDFLLFYLADYDFASHAAGPEAAYEALQRSDRAIGALVDAAGGPDEFLDRYAVIVCSDHGQTSVESAVRLQKSFADLDSVMVTASNRAGMIYRLQGCKEDAPALAARLDDEPAAGVILFRDGDAAIARRDGAELRFQPGEAGWQISGDPAVLEFPNGLERSWAALRNPNAGEVIISAAPGFEFADLAGRHHAGGGSHGSLDAGDSEVPMLTIGLEGGPAQITGLAPLVLTHFGVEPPAYAPGYVAVPAA